MAKKDEFLDSLLEASEVRRGTSGTPFSAGDNNRLKVTHDGASIGPHCLQFR